jgi:hypothetical protein
VKCGFNGEKGTIVDIVFPLGTYAMYKVQLFIDGEILTLAKHKLVKRVHDDLIMFIRTCTNNSVLQRKAIQVHTSILNLELLMACLKLQS